MLCHQLPAAGVVVERQQTLDHGVTFGPLDGLYAHLEPHVLQLLFKFSQTASANESDRASGDAEFLCNLLVRTRRSLEKQQTNHPLTSWRQLRNRVADHLFFFKLDKQVARKRRRTTVG